MNTEKLFIANEKKDGKTLINTGLSFNAKDSSSLLKMLSVVSLCEKYGVVVGQEVGQGFNNGGLISYKFLVPDSVIPNYIAEQAKPVPTDLMSLDLDNMPEPLPTDPFLAEMDALYVSFYNTLKY